MPGWLGWRLPGRAAGHHLADAFAPCATQITRLLIPNGYREHIDHEAVFAPGPMTARRWATRCWWTGVTAEPIRSTAVYAVWAI